MVLLYVKGHGVKALFVRAVYDICAMNAASYASFSRVEQ